MKKINLTYKNFRFFFPLFNSWNSWLNFIFAFIAILFFTCFSTFADILHEDDVIIPHHLAVGLQAQIDETFSNDVIRLKADTVRLYFDDSSSSGGSFPKNDWRIIINDILTGGDNYFGIEDSSAGAGILPFRIDAGAPTDSLRIYSDSGANVKNDMFIGGKLGINQVNQVNPDTDVHLASATTPTIRLEQDNSSGWSPQTWEVSGDESYFFVSDMTHSSNRVFSIGVAAPSNRFVIESITGDIGIGVEDNNPTECLHIRQADGTAKLLVEDTYATVAVRDMLELKNSGASALIMNNTDSSTSLRIDTSNDVFSIGLSDTSFLCLSSDGRLGLGMREPEETLHVKKTDGTARMLVEENSAVVATRELLELKNQGGAVMKFNNSDEGDAWHIGSRATDNLVISAVGTTGDEFVMKTDGQLEIGPGKSTVFTLDPAGNMEVDGTLAQGSDRTRKQNIEAANPGEILDKVISLPLATWNFKDDAADTQHIGPMAQDFHAAFDVGAKNTTIAPLDTGGVALSAIQGLYQKLEEKNQRIEKLKKKNKMLEIAVNNIVQRLDALEGN